MFRDYAVTCHKLITLTTIGLTLAKLLWTWPPALLSYVVDNCIAISRHWLNKYSLTVLFEEEADYREARNDSSFDNGHRTNDKGQTHDLLSRI